jgi:hypothetical protein
VWSSPEVARPTKLVGSGPAALVGGGITATVARHTHDWEKGARSTGEPLVSGLLC